MTIPIRHTSLPSATQWSIQQPCWDTMSLRGKIITSVATIAFGILFPIIGGYIAYSIGIGIFHQKTIRRLNEPILTVTPTGVPLLPFEQLATTKYKPATFTHKEINKAVYFHNAVNESRHPSAHIKEAFTLTSHISTAIKIFFGPFVRQSKTTMTPRNSIFKELASELRQTQQALALSDEQTRHLYMSTYLLQAASNFHTSRSGQNAQAMIYFTKQLLISMPIDFPEEKLSNDEIIRLSHWALLPTDALPYNWRNNLAMLPTHIPLGFHVFTTTLLANSSPEQLDFIYDLGLLLFIKEYWERSSHSPKK